MAVDFEQVGPQHVEQLAAWLPKERWPFHQRMQVDAAWVHERAAEGYFYGPGAQSHLLVDGGPEPLGLVRAFDLKDVTALVDIRIAERARGQGLGTRALMYVTCWAFLEVEGQNRLGGYTRRDNSAMIRIFERHGFMREAEHQCAWRVEGMPPTQYANAIGYAMLATKWAGGGPEDEMEMLMDRAYPLLGEVQLAHPGLSAGTVAAALRAGSGRTYTGVCLHLDCGIGFCAEHAAIAEMLKERETEIEAIVAVSREGVIAPCGRCRELMLQLNPKNAATRVALPGSRVVQLRDLLPER
jgi:cytidine deaminase